MTQDTLPPLPEPFGLFCGIRNDPPKTVEFWGMLNARETGGEKCNLYTEDQMRSYSAAFALTAIAAQAPTARHVGDSDFESWFAGYDPSGKGDKQRARDAYAAGITVAPMPLPVQAEPVPFAELVIERCFHEYQNSAKEDYEGYESRRLVTCLPAMDADLPLGRYPLYLAAQPQQPAPAAQEPPKLLTNEQIEPLVREFKRATFPPIASPELWFLRGIRAAEKAYGITGEKT